tara:strand:- start:3482 stop:5122 length:1641 start_codon:yes stop_codon:yes gene_type:complete
MKKNWNQLIENYYGQRETLNLSTLEQLVSEAMDNFDESTVLTEEQAPAVGGDRFSFSIPIPRLVPTEAWGDPSSQSRKDINRIFDSITRQPSIKARINHVNSFLDPAQAVKKAPGGKVNTVLNMLQIIEALQASLNDYNESSAGFVFEGFMAALTGGRQEAGRVGGTLPIEDFVTGDNENVSLKLLSPNTPIHGSFTNLIDYLFIRGETGVPSIKYLIAFKNSEDDTVAELALWDFEINRDNVVDIMVTSKNHGLLGSVAGKLKQHMQSFSDTPEWKLQMAELLQHAPGYSNKRGMFFKNVTQAGEFEIRADAVPDPSVKNNQFNIMLRAGELNLLKQAAKKEGALAAENGISFEEWMEELDLDALPPKLKSGAPSAKRKTALKDLEASFRRGYEEAVAKAEQPEAEQPEEVVTETYFGSFHEDEKRYMQEDLLFEARGSGDAKSQFSLSRGDMTKIEPIAQTQFYGTINLGQNNIDALTKIYIEKIGEDLMALLQNTKNFADNIGRYFSADDRTEAVQANKQAIAQGGQIITSLAADPAGPDSAE